MMRSLRIGTAFVAMMSLMVAPWYAIAAAATPAASTQSSADLQKKVNDQNSQIDAIDKDIAKYQQQLNVVSQKKQTLQTTVQQLDLSIKKTGATINATKGKINSTQLQILQLSGNIATKEDSIKRDQTGLAESLRQLSAADMQPLVLQLLSAPTISRAWSDTEALQSLQSAINDHIDTLSAEKKSLSDTKVRSEEKKQTLVGQQQALTQQQESFSVTKEAQSDLLKQTKSQESVYQKMIADKQAAKAEMQAALSDLKTQLQYTVKKSDVPTRGAGILSWPLDSVRITQYFGDTSFSRTGAYNGKGHNGIDFAASVGTPLHASLDGTVVGTGNTDAIRGCYSFGKWVLIKHANGLDTMYGHMSKINVSPGQTVHTGELIGYTGVTGFATGPHLHYGVYVAAATQIMKLGDATNKVTPCSGAVMPVAPLTGYLNPVDYLPKE